MQDLKNQSIWVIWKLKDNRKLPFSAITGYETGSSPDHSGEWTDYNTATAKLAELRSMAKSSSKNCKKAEGSVNSEDSEDSASAVSSSENCDAANNSAECNNSADSNNAADSVKRTKGGSRSGVGFIIPSDYFFLDVDHQAVDSPLVQELMALLPTYTEVSPSGEGIHFYGKCDVTRLPVEFIDGRKKMSSRYYTKNPNNGLELYVGGLTNRFSTFTGEKISEEDGLADCTSSLMRILEKWMRKNNTQCGGAGKKGGNGGLSAGSAGSAGSNGDSLFDEERFIRLTEDDIPAIISDLSAQKNGNKFRDLYENGTVGKSHSEADVSLCAMIAFRAGPNPDIIDKIFRQSKLYRDKWDRADYAKRTIAAGIEACHGNFHYSVKKRPPFIVENKGKYVLSCTELGEYVRTHLDYLPIEESIDFCRMYVFEHGAYHPVSRDKFTGYIKEYVRSYNYNLVKMATIGQTVADLYTPKNTIPNYVLNTCEMYVNFQNGLLDLETMMMLPHSPKVYSTVQLPLNYNPKNRNTPVFDRYLDTLTNGVADKKRFLLEFMGACFSNFPGGEMKKALFMFGNGNTGKSQLILLMARILGIENYAAMDLSHMEARFGAVGMYRKRLVGSADISFLTVSELNIFKKATAGDFIQGEYKGKDSFWFIFKGLLWFAMNRLPKFGGDDGKWVYDRIIPFECKNVIPEDKKDSKIMLKMYAEREGIVCKALEAFRDVIINNGCRFHEPAEADVIRDKYRLGNNSALEFFSTMMEKREGDIARDDPSTVEVIYRAYGEWYVSQNYKSNYKKSKKDFFQDIADYLGEEYEDMKKRVHSGICLKGYVLKEEMMPLV